MSGEGVGVPGGRGEQREDSADLVGVRFGLAEALGEEPGDGLAVAVGGRVEGDAFDAGAACGEGVVDGGRVGAVVVGGGGDEQPGAGQRGVAAALGPGGRGRPGDAVAPVVDERGLGGSAPPVGEPGEHVVEGRVGGQVQRAGQGLDVGVLDGRPEAGLFLAGGGGGAGGGRGRGGVEPEPAALEGVGGQGDGPGAQPREGGGPVGGDAADVGVGERGEEAGRSAVAAAQGGDDVGGGAGGLGGLLEADGEDGVRAALDEDLVAVLHEPEDGGLEPHGGAEVGVPVGGVEVGGGDGFAGDGGVEGHPRGFGVMPASASASSPSMISTWAEWEA